MHERILVPVDGSPRSKEVLPYATAIAGAMGAELALLRAVRRESERAAAQRDIDALAAANAAAAATVVLADEPSAAILAEAKRQPRTLVAMSTQGRGGLMEAILGSVAWSVVRASTEPVLLYRPCGPATGPRRPVELRTVVLPIDGHPESETMAPQAATLARALDADLEVVQVILPGTRRFPAVEGYGNHESAWVESRADEIREQHVVRTRWTLLHGDPVDALRRHVGERRDVILAMATRAHRPLQEFVLGSVTSGCLRTTGVPILTRRP